MGLLAYLKTQFIVHLLIGFVFVGSGLVINFVQLCTLVLWPLNKQLYRRLNCRLAYSLWSRECCPRRACRGGGAGRQVGRDGLCARRSPCQGGGPGGGERSHRRDRKAWPGWRGPHRTEGLPRSGRQTG